MLVTGGTGTLGVHVVRGLRERGCHVRMLSRNQRAGIQVSDVGGPEVCTWAEMVRQYLRATGRTPTGHTGSNGGHPGDPRR